MSAFWTASIVIGADDELVAINAVAAETESRGGKR